MDFLVDGTTAAGVDIDGTKSLTDRKEYKLVQVGDLEVLLVVGARLSSAREAAHRPSHVPRHKEEGQG